MQLFTGNATALVTPFLKGEVDFVALKHLIEYQIQNKTDALVICGTTGEPATLSAQEKEAVIKFAIKEVNKRVPVIVGTGANSTSVTIENSKNAQEWGADALLVVTPYYNKCTQKGLISHFFAVADSVDLPIILYNVPSRTGVNILPSTVAQLCQHKNIVGLKEASGNIAQICEIARLCPALKLYSGDDASVVPLLSLGGVGVISVVGNVIPHIMSSMCHAYLQGDVKLALELQLKMLPFAQASMSEVNPIPIKAACALKGLCTNEVRLPLTVAEPTTIEQLKNCLKEL